MQCILIMLRFVVQKARQQGSSRQNCNVGVATCDLHADMLIIIIIVYRRNIIIVGIASCLQCLSTHTDTHSHRQTQFTLRETCSSPVAAVACLLLSVVVAAAAAVRCCRLSKFTDISHCRALHFCCNTLYGACVSSYACRARARVRVCMRDWSWVKELQSEFILSATVQMLLSCLPPQWTKGPSMPQSATALAIEAPFQLSITAQNLHLSVYYTCRRLANVDVLKKGVSRAGITRDLVASRRSTALFWELLMSLLQSVFQKYLQTHISTHTHT